MTTIRTDTFPLGLAVEITEGWNDAKQEPTMRGRVVLHGPFRDPFELFDCELNITYTYGDPADNVTEVLERWQEETTK